MADEVYADLLDSLSPLTKAGIDPDAARMDRAGTMAKLMGSDSPSPAPWYQQGESDSEDPQQAAGKQPQQVSPNGNVLPPGLQSRVPQPPRSGTPGSGTEPGPDESQSGSSTPAVPASVTQMGNATKPSDLAVQNAGTIGVGQNNYVKSAADVDVMAAQPNEQDDPAIQKALAMQANYATPTNPNLKEYKPSIAQRIIRGVQAFGSGGLTGPANYGAPNDEYKQAEAERQAKYGLAGTQLQQAQKMWEDARKKAEAVQAARVKVTDSLPAATNPSIQQQEVPIKQQQADTEKQRADNEGPDAKVALKAGEFDQLQKQADTMGLKGSQRTLFLANGKLPDPKQQTADEIALQQATVAWHHDNPGKQPGLEDVRSIRAAASGSDVKGGTKATAPRDDEAQAIVADSVAEKEKWANGYKRSADGTRYENKDAKEGERHLTPEQYAARLDEFRTKANTKLAAKGWLMDETGKMVRTSGGGGEASPQSAPAAPAGSQPAGATVKPTPKTHPVGSIIMVNGRPMKITGYNPTTGKAIVAPQ